MTRRLLLGLLLLAACGDGDGSAPADKPAGPAAPGDGYVGRWAAAPELCAGGAWVFAPRRLVTAGEVACDFQRVTPDAQGWSVEAACSAEGDAAPARLRLARAEGGGLTVSGGPFEGAVTLRLCAENWGAAPGTATASPTNP